MRRQPGIMNQIDAPVAQRHDDAVRFLAVEIDGCLRLNEEGLAWTDTIGPWLYSAAVTARMNAYELA